MIISSRRHRRALKGLNFYDTSVRPTAWYRSDAGIVTNSQSTVQAWANQAGSDYDMYEHFLSSQFDYITSGSVKGYPCLRNTAGVYRSIVTPTIYFGAGQLEVFVVAKLTTNPPVIAGSNGFWSFGSAQTGTDNCVFPNTTTGVIVDDFGSTTFHTTSNVSTALNSVFIYNVTSAPNSWIARMNNSVVCNDVANTVSGNDIVQFGVTYSGKFFRGELYELIMFKDVSLSTTQRNNIYNSLSTRYV